MISRISVSFGGQLIMHRVVLAYVLAQKNTKYSDELLALLFPFMIGRFFVMTTLPTNRMLKRALYCQVSVILNV
jgi:hypothetical protein